MTPTTQTLLNQLGGANKIAAMTGAQIVTDDKNNGVHLVFKRQVGKAGKFVGQQAVQLHGGMGVTEELNVGHYFKRLTTIGTIFGNADFHLKQYTSL